MGTPLVADAFFDVLEKSGLLSPAEIAAAIEEYKLYSKKTAKNIATTLVKHGVLTRFQANRLLADGVRLFATALVLSVVTQISDLWTVILIGLINTTLHFFGTFAKFADAILAVLEE